MNLKNTTLCCNVIEGLQQLTDRSVHTVITSPPYFGLRNYQTKPQHWPEVTYSMFGFEMTIPEMECSLGLEKTPAEYIGHIVYIFREVRRVLRNDGTCWINIGDSYSGSGGAHKEHHKNPGLSNSFKRGGVNKQYSGLKQKDLIGIPWSVAFALREDGWWLRQDIIWHKTNNMPESCEDRTTKAHEYIFLLSKSKKYFFDHEAIKIPVVDATVIRMQQKIEQQQGSSGPGKKNGPMKAVGSDSIANKKSVWSVSTNSFVEEHYATMPEDLAVDMIKAGSSEAGCCRKCGKPLQRIVEKNNVGNTGETNTKYDAGSTAGRLAKKRSAARAQGSEFVNNTRTVGWKFTCHCHTAGISIEESVMPCIVLDPFSGACTTGLVARKLGRDYIGIELNQKYVRMGNDRLAELGMFPTMPLAVEKDKIKNQLGMF